MFIKDEAKHQELKAKGQAVEQLLQSPEHSEQDKQQKLMEYLNLLKAERAADLGVIFTERMLERVAAAFEAHPTADLAVDQLYTCLLLQQFHSMQFDAWRAHPAIENCRPALTLLQAEGRWSDCLRYCQDTANTQCKTVELQQLTSLHLVARKTMEHATRQLVAIALQDSHHLVLRLATVYHQRQMQLYRPAHLLFESLQLLLFEFTAPIVVEPHLADGDRRDAIG